MATLRPACAHAALCALPLPAACVIIMALKSATSAVVISSPPWPSPSAWLALARMNCLQGAMAHRGGSVVGEIKQQREDLGTGKMNSACTDERKAQHMIVQLCTLLFSLCKRKRGKDNAVIKWKVRCVLRGDQVVASAKRGQSKTTVDMRTHSPACRSASLKCGFAVGVLDGLRRKDFDVEFAGFHLWAAMHGMCSLLINGRLDERHPAWPIADQAAFVENFTRSLIVSFKARPEPAAVANA